MMNWSFQQAHDEICRWVFGFWGGVLGFASPFLLLSLWDKTLAGAAWVQGVAALLMALLAFCAYRFIAPWFFAPMADYLTENATKGLRIKAAFAYLFIAFVLIVSTPWGVALLKGHVVATTAYFMAMLVMGAVYGVQLLLIAVKPRALFKAGVIGFNSASIINVIGLILFYCAFPRAMRLADGTFSVMALLHTVSLNLTIMGLYSLLTSVMLCMAVYYINSKQ